MNLARLIFGERPTSPALVTAPPPGVRVHQVRSKNAPAKRAWLADKDRPIGASGGALEARAGQDYVVEHADGECSVVRGDIFEATYEPLGGGLYRKRTDVILSYFTLKRSAVVQTLEGQQHARAGDWIMQGVAGELWPISPEKAQEKYEPV